MCGRFNVIDDPITQSIMDILGIDFSVSTNDNVCPSELVSTLSFAGGEIVQINAKWGIKPDWANKLLINAQSETVSNKKTFKNAFLNSRCLIPISGWYEWRSEESGKKQKYLFSNQEQVFYMAGVMFQNHPVTESEIAFDLFGEVSAPAKSHNQFVSLTTQANEQCNPIHSRMPLIIPKAHIKDWLSSDIATAGELLHSDTVALHIQKAT